MGKTEPGETHGEGEAVHRIIILRSEIYGQKKATGHGYLRNTPNKQERSDYSFSHLYHKKFWTFKMFKKHTKYGKKKKVWAKGGGQ